MVSSRAVERQAIGRQAIMTINIHHDTHRTQAGTRTATSAATAARRPTTWDTRLDLPTPAETAAMVRDVKLPS